MIRNRKIIIGLVGIIALSFVGCSREKNINSSQEINSNQEATNNQSVGDQEIEKEEAKETIQEENKKNYIHDEGYEELIHGGFSIRFQTLMEEMYSHINYEALGTSVEEIRPMDELFITDVEAMTDTLNVVQDGEILNIVNEARNLFDEINEVIKSKKYEQLAGFNDRGQELYNKYYEWLMKVAENHKHE